MHRSHAILIALLLGTVTIGFWLLREDRRGEVRPESTDEVPASGPARLHPVEEAELVAPPAREPASRAPAKAALPASPLPSAADAQRVLGTVVDDEGRPIAGATVHFFDHPLFEAPQVDTPVPTGPLRARASAVTGADGRFDFPAPSAGVSGISAAAEGFAPKQRNQSPGVDARLELEPAATLVGRILGAAGDVRVFHTGVSSVDGVLAKRRVQVSDGDRYQVSPLPLGRGCVLEIVPSNGLTYEEHVSISARGTNVYDLEIGEPLRVVAYVEEAFSKAPIAGARLVLTVDEAISVATSDARGRLELDLVGLPARVVGRDPRSAQSNLWTRLELHARGHFSRAVSFYELDGKSDTHFELTPAARLEGVVLDTSGTPVPGAQVAWVAPFSVHDRTLGSLSNPPASRASTCDAAGRFVLPEVLWAQDFSCLQVSIDGVVRTHEYGVAPEAPGTTRFVEIRLPALPSLRGILAWEWSLASATDLRARLDPQRDVQALPALPRLTVELQPIGDDGTPTGEPARRAESAADGSFCFESLRPGWYRIEGEAPGRATAGPNTLEVRDAANTFVLRLAPVRRAARGRVTSARGEPLVNHELSLLPLAVVGDLDPNLRGAGALRTRTDAEGEFTADVLDLPQLRYEVSLRSGELELSHELDLAALDWALPELASVRLAFPNGKRPAEAARLRWTGPTSAQHGLGNPLSAGADGLQDVVLPVGALELEWTGGGETQRALVRVTGAADAVLAVE